jgi:hypothetical protein
MSHDIAIQGPDGELRIFLSGDHYLWNVWNDGPRDLQDVQLRIDSFQSFNFKKHAFRDAKPFNCPWPAARTLEAGDKTPDAIFVRFEHENIGFGNGNGMYLLPWPTGDSSITRYWRLNMRVDGFAEPWPIELYVRWTFGGKLLELMQSSDIDSDRKFLNTAQPEGRQGLAPTSPDREREAELHRELQRELDRDILERGILAKLERECLTGKRRYPTTLYHPDGVYRVVHGPEEHATLKIEGWDDTPIAGKEYRVWTAVPNGQETTQAAVDSIFWRMLREEFEELESGEYSLIWSSRPPVSLDGTVLPSLWSWWRYPGENQRARFSAIALKGAKALGHSSEDGWLDELRKADFVHFKLTGSSRQKQPDGTMVESESGAIEDVRNFSITLCHVLEAAAAAIFFGHRAAF